MILEIIQLLDCVNIQTSISLFAVVFKLVCYL